MSLQMSQRIVSVFVSSYEREIVPIINREFNSRVVDYVPENMYLSDTQTSSWRTQFQLLAVQTMVKGSACLLGTKLKCSKHLEACSEACGLKCRSLRRGHCSACQGGTHTWIQWSVPPVVSCWGP